MHLSRTLRSASSKLVLLSCCVLATSPAAFAEDASHRAKVEEMLRLTKTESGMHEQITNLQTRIDQLSKQQFNLPSPTPEQTTLINEYEGKIKQITSDEVGWEQLRPKLIDLYSGSFTDAELDGIIAFYKSPAGISLVSKMPDVAGKTNSLVQDRIKDLQPKLASLTQSYADKLKPAPAAAAPAPSPSKPAAPKP